jgi:hypothetical protein
MVCDLHKTFKALIRTFANACVGFVSGMDQSERPSMNTMFHIAFVQSICSHFIKEIE